MSRILSPATPIAPPTPIDAAGTQTKRLKSKSSFSFSRRKSPSTSSKPPFPTPSSPPLVQASSPVTAHKEFTTKSPIPSQRFDQSPRLADHPPPRQSPVVHQVESPRIHDVPPLPAKTFEEDVRAGVGSTPVVGDEAEEDERGDEMGSGYVRDEIEEDSEEEKRRKRFSLRDFQLPAHEMDSSEFGLFGGEFGTMGESDYDFASNVSRASFVLCATEIDESNRRLHSSTSQRCRYDSTPFCRTHFIQYRQSPSQPNPAIISTPLRNSGQTTPHVHATRTSSTSLLHRRLSSLRSRPSFFLVAHLPYPLRCTASPLALPLPLLEHLLLPSDSEYLPPRRIDQRRE